MADGKSEVGPRGNTFDSGEGPQLLNHLQGTGAEVVGSDGEKVGNLKEVGDATFVVYRRTLRRDISIPMKHIVEVTTDTRIVLDAPEDQVDDIGWSRPPFVDTKDGYTPFAETDEDHHGGT